MVMLEFSKEYFPGHVCMATLQDEQEMDQMRAAICETLRVGDRLLAVDLGSMTLDHEIWTALPSGLTSLCCSAASAGPHIMKNRTLKKGFLPFPGTAYPRSHKWRVLKSLQSIELTGLCRRGPAHGGITFVDGLLHVAPGVNKLHFRHTKVIEVPFVVQLVPYLQSLDRRMDAGLKVTGLVKPVLAESNIQLRFMVGYGPDPATMLELMADKIGAPLRNFSVVDLSFDHRRVRVNLHHLPRVLSSIVELTLFCLDVELPDVEALVRCVKLQKLVLRSVNIFSKDELKLLCLASVGQSLRLVLLEGCSSFKEELGSVDHKTWMESKVRVKVSHGF